MSEAQSPEEFIKDREPPSPSMIERIEELEDMVQDLQQQVEDLERDQRESQMHNRFDGGY